MGNNQIRIVAGEWRGRKIYFGDAEGLRPTSERIRETLFNWISAKVPESQCLDLFAGSGALGLEALSRGAKHVSFIDNNRRSLQSIEAALATLNCTKASLFCQKAQQFIAEQGINGFDIIFIDPPYAKFDLLDMAEAMEDKFEDDKNCLIFYEHDKAFEETKLPTNWLIKKQKKAGRVHYYLINRIKMQTG